MVTKADLLAMVAALPDDDGPAPEVPAVAEVGAATAEAVGDTAAAVGAAVADAVADATPPPVVIDTPTPAEYAEADATRTMAEAAAAATVIDAQAAADAAVIDAQAQATIDVEAARHEDEGDLLDGILGEPEPPPADTPPAPVHRWFRGFGA